MDLLNAKHEQIFNFAPHTAIHIDGEGVLATAATISMPISACGEWGEGGRNTPTIFA